MTDQPDWTEQARRLMAGLSGMFAGQAASSDGDSGSSDCRWCPLCQAAAVLRGERPEVSAAVADILATASAALRSLAGEAAPAPDAAPETPASAGPDVQRIEIA